MGTVDHTSENCSKLRENIAREKADINRRNIEKYEASKQHTAKGQENAYQTQQGKADNEGRTKQVPDQPPSPGEPHIHLEAPLLLLLVTHSSVSSTFGARSCMARTLKYLF